MDSPVGTCALRANTPDDGCAERKDSQLKVLGPLDERAMTGAIVEVGIVERGGRKSCGREGGPRKHAEERNAHMGEIAGLHDV